MILTGSREERMYIELDEHRMGFSIRPALRLDPNPGPAVEWLSIACGIALVIAFVGVLVLIVHALLPSVN